MVVTNLGQDCPYVPRPLQIGWPGADWRVLKLLEMRATAAQAHRHNIAFPLWQRRGLHIHPQPLAQQAKLSGGCQLYLVLSITVVQEPHRRRDPTSKDRQQPASAVPSRHNSPERMELCQEESELTQPTLALAMSEKDWGRAGNGWTT